MNESEWLSCTDPERMYEFLALAGKGSDRKMRLLRCAWLLVAISNRGETMRVMSRQAAIFRDVFGNPFRPPVFDPAWRTPTVTALAAAAYEERELPAGTLDTQRLAVLADALEDAGCTNERILVHLRESSPHVRGCWVIDLLLGKE